jgi:hypothetical protein
MSTPTSPSPPRSIRTRRVRSGGSHLRFDQRLILCEWLFGLFGVKNLKELTGDGRWDEYEGFTEDGQTVFLPLVSNRKGNHPSLSRDVLAEYDGNIVRHWREITARRQESGRRPLPKYFQYLAILFSEIYLDRYFSDSEKLRLDLNQKVAIFNTANDDRIPLYQGDDLRKLALWSATGSGKTLLMHVNIKQYTHYLRKHGRERELNKIILLTPNERLSEQHRAEFDKSNIRAEIFRKDAATLFQEDRVEIIDIHKLKDESKQKTVDVEAFEGNNLVLVDEGHRGASGEESVWMKYRAELCAQGFSFEYSATFGQAMRATNNLDLPNQYAKCIVFDYSYKYFYRDGYGKQYQIMNLEDWVADNREMYLTACLLAFYQQLRIFRDFREEVLPYNIEKPLWVFVAARVSATPTAKEISDVVDVLLFLNRFLATQNREVVFGRLDALVSGVAALVDREQRALFRNTFDYLATLGMSTEQLYLDILRLLFNAPVAGTLRVNWLKRSDGELSLHVGGNSPFGVVNIGDAQNLFEQSRREPSLNSSEQELSDSLFATINAPHSSINILVGAKKFTEGWNSFRVTTLGLMNVGKSEGSQIIQLFGRGVRLWGRDFTLKRSKALPGRHPEHLPALEKLYVFGLKADYMDRFREFLDAEGVPAETIELSLPIVKRSWPSGLRVLRAIGFDFKRDGEKPILDKWPGGKSPRVVLDWYPRVFSLRANDEIADGRKATKNEGKLTSAHLAFINIDVIYLELQRLKSEKDWHNLSLRKEKVAELLNDQSWYTLLIPPQILDFRDFDQVRIWEQIAIALLKKYCERFYNYQKSAAEAPHLKYVPLKADDENFIEGDQYIVRLDEDNASLQRQLVDLRETITRLREAISRGDFSGIALAGFGPELKPLFIPEHLYHPLIYATGVEVTPVALNDGERQFVEDLRGYYQSEKAGLFAGKELYLLRNRTRGRGIGFFEAGNFYPDFIVWVLSEGIQYITFVDPKGIIHEFSLDSPKLQLHRVIKEKEQTLNDPQIVLNSFILSRTSFNQINWISARVTKQNVQDQNVLFLEDGGNIYLQQLFTKILAKRIEIGK